MSDIELTTRAERLSFPGMVLMLTFAAVALPWLIGQAGVVPKGRLIAWGILTSAVAATITGRYIAAVHLGAQVALWTRAESIVMAFNLAVLAWLTPDLAAHESLRFVLATVIVAVTTLGALNAWYLVHFRRTYTGIVAVVATSYSVAFSMAQNLILALFCMTWSLVTLHFAHVGFDSFTELNRLRRESERSARLDDLTLLHTRAAFIAELETRAQSGEVYSLVLIDLDGFKAINDGFGHGTGDSVLRTVAARLTEALPTDTLLGRLGGDEFAALVPVGPTQLASPLEQTLARVAEPIEVNGRTLYVAGSAGWTGLNQAESSAELLAQADAAMYASKNSGTVASTEFSIDLREELDRSLAMRQAFRAGVRGAMIDFVAQPIVRADSERPIAVELLARWPADSEIMIATGDFNRLADETGLAVDLDRLALTQARDLLGQWRDDPVLGRIVVKVNVSPLHLQNHGLERTIVELIPARDRDRLGLEFVETKLIASAERNDTQLRDLKSMGVTLSIDDFGVGYSSLAYLRRLPVSELKIDRSFVVDIDTDSVNQGLVRAMVNMASTLGLPTVAEGIESLSELNTIRRLGVSAVQGFVLGRPQSIPSVEAHIYSMAERSLRSA